MHLVDLYEKKYSHGKTYILTNKIGNDVTRITLCDSKHHFCEYDTYVKSLTFSRSLRNVISEKGKIPASVLNHIKGFFKFISENINPDMTYENFIFLKNKKMSISNYLSEVQDFVSNEKRSEVYYLAFYRQ